MKTFYVVMLIMYAIAVYILFYPNRP